MALRDRVANDIGRCFLRAQHFAETRHWNGVPILCVPDEEMALKRKNNNVSDISWDNNTRSVVLHTPLEGFPGGREPEPNTHVMLDNRQMRVVSVAVNMGVLDITLSAADPMEVA